jgi:hypothetical protein
MTDFYRTLSAWPPFCFFFPLRKASTYNFLFLLKTRSSSLPQLMPHEIPQPSPARRPQRTCTSRSARRASQNRRQLGLWGSTYPPFPERIAALSSVAARLPAGGQLLAERFNWYMNPVNLSKSYASAGTGGREFDGSVSRGVVVLQSGTLFQVARVKVRLDEKFDQENMDYWPRSDASRMVWP